MIDKALILRKLSELEEYLKQVKEFSNISIKDYQKDWKTQRIVERTLQMMVQEQLFTFMMKNGVAVSEEE